MIITQIIGGLGNQMFQYAAGRALSFRLNSKLYLDISRYSKYNLHQGFELGKIFDCEYEIATSTELKYVVGWQRHKMAQNLICSPYFSRFRRKEFIVEPSHSYWSGYEEISHKGFLRGYWQSYKYIEDYAAIIKKDFRFISPEIIG